MLTSCSFCKPKWLVGFPRWTRIYAINEVGVVPMHFVGSDAYDWTLAQVFSTGYNVRQKARTISFVQFSDMLEVLTTQQDLVESLIVICYS